MREDERDERTKREMNEEGRVKCKKTNRCVFIFYCA
jgi:hypothetical protein